MIKNILYDYGFVLAYPKSGNWFFPVKMNKLLGTRNYLTGLFHMYKFPSSFRKAYQKLNENHLLHTEEEELEQFIEFYITFLSGIGIHKNIRSIARALANETVLSDEKVTFYNDVIDELKKAHKIYKIGILSDTWPSLKRLLEHQGILEHLDGLIMSCDYGICKDNIELFYFALKELDIRPEETVFIDDSQSNLDNAASIGIIPILMDRRNKVKESIYPIVHNLGEAYQYIRSYEK